MKRILTCFCIVVCLAGSALSQEFWEKKELTQWSKNDCQKLLSDSPWAASSTLGTLVLERIGRQTDDPATPSRETSPQITYTAQLWSAKPIRMAVVRTAQLDPEFIKLPADQQKSHFEKQNQFVNESFPDVVLVRLSYSTNTQVYVQDLARYWQNQIPAELRKNISLIGSFGRIQPTDMQVGKGGSNEIRLTFPRMVNGKPVLAAGDKRLSLEFQHPDIGVLTTRRVLLSFSPKKMTFKGELTF